MWRNRWRCVIKPAYSVSFLLSINIFVWQNTLYFPNDLRILRVWTGFIWHSIRGDFCEHGDESLGPIQGREFIDQLSDSQPLRRWNQTLISLCSKNWGKSDFTPLFQTLFLITWPSNWTALCFTSWHSYSNFHILGCILLLPQITLKMATALYAKMWEQCQHAWCWLMSVTKSR